MLKVEFKVEAMMCDGCVNRIKNVLNSVKRINKYNISLECKMVTLEVINDKVLDKVKDKIENIGFKIS